MPLKKVKKVDPQHKYRLYSPTALNNAYLAVKETKMTVRGAARQYNIPLTTLRDRVDGRVSIDTTKSGKNPILSNYQESMLAEHLKVMANFGYGYTRQEVVDLATDFAIQQGLRSNTRPLTLKWFRGFMGRWPELKVNKPRQLEISRARSASVSCVDKYFDELKMIMEKYGFDVEPHLIYNVDEKGFSQNHTPPGIVCSGDAQPQSVTAGKSSTITVIGCGSASGVAIPPFIIFPGKRMLPKLMDGGTPGVTGRMSDSGWSNSDLFKDYLENHFLKYAPKSDDQKILLLLDGHKSHASVGLANWAKEKGIISYILPAHTSHILQPLDVGCYGPLQNIFNNECHKLVRESHGTIVRENMCQLICKSYTKALSPENLISSFKKTGIFPHNRNKITELALKPAEVFILNEVHEDLHTEPPTENFFSIRESNLKEIKSALVKKPMNTMSKIISGRCITEDHVMEQMENHERCHAPNKSREEFTVQKKSVKRKLSAKEVESDDSEDESIEEKDLCCVCEKYSPAQLSNSVGLALVKWVQCDGIRNGMPCLHWTHLKYCSEQRVIRRGTQFYCIHCQ